MVMRLRDVGHYQPMFETNEGDACLEQLELTPRTRLMGDFLYKGDFAVLCGTEGSGKSILAFQLADALSKGSSVEGFANDAAPQKVLFLDFENKHERFLRRYSEQGQNKYKLSPNFCRTTFSHKFTEYVGLKKEVHVELNRRIPGRQPEVLVVNNLDVAKCFLSESFLLSLLKEYQARLNLTVILVTSINPGKAPLFLNRLGKNLRSMADSVIAIGQSKNGKNIRYLKQLKSSTEVSFYDENELPEFTIEQRGNFTGFCHKGFGLEEEHLTGPPAGLDLDIINLKNQQPSLTYKEIADQLETNKTRVMRALDRGLRGASEHGLSGLVDCADGKPMAKSEQTVGAVVTSTVKNDITTGASSFSNPRLQPGGMEEEESSPCPLLSPATHPQGGMPSAEPGHLLTKITDTPAPLPTDPFRGEVVQPDHPSDPGVESEHGLSRLRDGADAVKSQLTVDTLVTSTVKNDITTGAPSFSNPRLQPGGMEEEKSSPCPLLSPAAHPQGGMPNAEPGHLLTKITDMPASLPTDPFRGEVEKSGHPSDPGVESERGLNRLRDGADGDTTSYCKSSQPKEQNKVPFSQRVKQQIAQNNVKRLRGG